MKRIVTFVAAAFVVAAPLFAEEQKPAAEKPKAKPATTQAAPAATAAPMADSPMVAAAKATKKSGKKIIVITNDNLTKEGTGNAHITTTKESRDIIVPPEDPIYVEARKAEARAKAQKEHDDREAAKKAKATAAADQKVRNVSGRQELDGPYGDDPAAAEHILEELAKAKQEQEQAKPPIE